MEGQDVGAVARVIAESFGTVMANPEVGNAAWENAAIGAVEKLFSQFDVAEYSVGLSARCGGRLRRPKDITVADDPSSLVGCSFWE